MPNKVIPADTRLAAKRGFVRTTAQAYGTALGGIGVTAVALHDVLTALEVWQIVAGVLAFLLSPLVAGLASYLSIVGKGVPEEYQAPASMTPNEVPGMNPDGLIEGQ